MPKARYEKRGEVAYVTLNRPEVKNAIDVETHELLCEIWADFRDDVNLRVAVLTGTGDAFTAGADLKTHAPEWQRTGPMVGRERIASDRAQFGTFEVRRGMHPADGGIVRLVNACGTGFALELLLTGEPVSAQRAYAANMVNRVVPHDELEAQTGRLVATILRCDQAAIESAKANPL